MGDIELAFYDKFFFSKDLSPYPVQEQAFDRIFAGESLLVMVPTGTGKTMMAKAAIYKALALHQTAVYTTPLRALTEEKFRELCDDFGEQNVGFATGDYKVNPKAPVQVVVAEILWNRIFGERENRPADVVVMDEGHYFNTPDRGYVWEQSIIGLDPRAQLVILSATVGNPRPFCQWVSMTRKVPLELVESNERRVPLQHEFREAYLIEVVRDLFHNGEYPAIVFVFGRELCFETARLLKTCRRFTTDDEVKRINELCDATLLDRGGAKDLRPLLVHGIGIHHAGVLPRYKRLVEQLVLERLVKFVVSTETISAGINLPAKRVVFPSLRKVIKGKKRLLIPAEYHQMAGRAGRPQFDKEGIAITLAPEQVVQELRKEIKEAKQRHHTLDEGRLRRGIYARLRGDAVRAGDVLWDPESHEKLVGGAAAPLRSTTNITADMLLAIGVPDLKPEVNVVSEGGEDGVIKIVTASSAAAPPELPVSYNLNARTVVENLFIDDKNKGAAHKRLDMMVANLQALGILDDHGRHVTGQLIRSLRGIDGPFVYYCLKNHDLLYEGLRALVEFLIEHDVIHNLLSRKDDDKRREWCRQRLRERRIDEPQVTWDDVEAEYEQKFPRELTPIEVIHNTFLALLPHPELHGGKTAKAIWAKIEDEQLSFLDFVERNDLQNEEGNLFTYLARVMKTARMLHEATTMDEFHLIEKAVRAKLGAVDDRVIDELWSA